MQVICPRCGYHKPVDTATIPVDAIANCPRCRLRFRTFQGPAHQQSFGKRNDKPCSTWRGNSLPTALREEDIEKGDGGGAAQVMGGAGETVMPCRAKTTGTASQVAEAADAIDKVRNGIGDSTFLGRLSLVSLLTGYLLFGISLWQPSLMIGWLDGNDTLPGLHCLIASPLFAFMILTGGSCGIFYSILGLLLPICNLLVFASYRLHLYYKKSPDISLLIATAVFAAIAWMYPVHAERFPAIGGIGYHLWATSITCISFSFFLEACNRRSTERGCGGRKRAVPDLGRMTGR